MDSFRFELSLFDGHPIIEDGANRILIDTGSPLSMHSTNKLCFLGKEYNTATSIMGVTSEKITGFVGTPITSLLGCDILREYKILFDYHGREISFCKSLAEQPFETVLPFVEYMGIPIVEIEIAGNRVSCFLDTGAKLSYLDPSITSQFEKLGEEEDFYPGYGRFLSSTYLIEGKIDGHPFTAKYGNLPQLLQMSLMCANGQGIIGFDLFNNFTILLDYENKKLNIRSLAHTGRNK